MSISTLLFVIAAAIFFLVGVKPGFLPEIWGLFFVALGLAAGGIPWPGRKE